jgi:hypothetical protein
MTTSGWRAEDQNLRLESREDDNVRLESRGSEPQAGEQGIRT